ncbi:MAG: hypothetical protein OEY70_06715, partial [Acidimicrobiia bacterium]|nr:hypothetical protein [Acidimicrobiia bacterium]
GGPVDAWQDRAVFHVLIAPGDQHAYVSAAATAVRPGGHVVLVGFGLTGAGRMQRAAHVP